MDGMTLVVESSSSCIPYQYLLQQLQQAKCRDILKSPPYRYTDPGTNFHLIGTPRALLGHIFKVPHALCKDTALAAMIGTMPRQLEPTALRCE